MNVDTCSDVKLLRTYSHLLEDETRALAKRLTELAEENARLRGEEQANLALEIGLLQEKLARREQEQFGDSSERRDRNAGDSDRERKPRTGHGPHKQPELPIVEVVHELDEADCICPNCGGLLGEMAGQYEETEEVDVFRSHYVIKRHKRKKLACCTCKSCIDTALGPDKLIEGGRYSLDFAVEVAVAKYADHSVPRRRAQQPRGRRSKPCCMDDEGWPLGIGVQAQVPNHPELRGSRARVVSVGGNGAARSRQVRSRKTSVSEPLMTCREVSTRRRNRAVWLARDEPRGSLQTGWAASGMKAA